MIREEDFRLARDDDVTRVGLENELLSLEVEVLKAKLSNFDAVLAEKEETIVERNQMVSEKNLVIKERNATIGKRDRTIADLRTRLEQTISEGNRTIADLRTRLEQTVQLRKGKVLVDRKDYEDLKKARQDLRWTLERLGKTPFVGPLIRHRAGFVRLIDRYLSD